MRFTKSFRCTGVSRERRAAPEQWKTQAQMRSGASILMNSHNTRARLPIKQLGKCRTQRAARFCSVGSLCSNHINTRLRLAHRYSIKRTKYQRSQAIGLRHAASAWRYRAYIRERIRNMTNPTCRTPLSLAHRDSLQNQWNINESLGFRSDRTAKRC